MIEAENTMRKSRKLHRIKVTIKHIEREKFFINALLKVFSKSDNEHCWSSGQIKSLGVEMRTRRHREKVLCDQYQSHSSISAPEKMITFVSLWQLCWFLLTSHLFSEAEKYCKLLCDCFSKILCLYPLNLQQKFETKTQLCSYFMYDARL